MCPFLTDSHMILKLPFAHKPMHFYPHIHQSRHSSFLLYIYITLDYISQCILQSCLIHSDLIVARKVQYCDSFEFQTPHFHAFVIVRRQFEEYGLSFIAIIQPNPTYFPVIPKILPQMETTIQTKEKNWDRKKVMNEKIHKSTVLYWKIKTESRLSFKKKRGDRSKEMHAKM